MCLGIHAVIAKFDERKTKTAFSVKVISATDPKQCV